MNLFFTGFATEIKITKMITFATNFVKKEANKETKKKKRGGDRFQGKLFRDPIAWQYACISYIIA